MGKLLKNSCLLACFQSSFALDHLASYWPLDQNANDLASAGAVIDNGAFIGAPSYTAGILGQGITLDGTNYITIPNSPDNDGKSQTMTISAWCKTSAFTNSKQAIVAQGDSNDWRITRAEGTNNLSFGGGGPQPLDTTSNDFNDGEWHHVLGVAHKNNAVRFYVDGVLIGSGGTSSLNQNSTRATFIGSNPNVPSRSWVGEIDDVGIFHAPLNAHQAKAIHDLAKDPTYSYALNELFRIFESASGTSGMVKEALWSHVTAPPSMDATSCNSRTTGAESRANAGPKSSRSPLIVSSSLPAFLSPSIGRSPPSPPRSQSTKASAMSLPTPAPERERSPSHPDLRPPQLKPLPPPISTDSPPPPNSSLRSPTFPSSTTLRSRTMSSSPALP